MRIVQKIQTAISTTIEFEDKELRVSSSIGICLFKENVSSNDELIKRADIAMYRAKGIDEKVAIY